MKRRDRARLRQTKQRHRQDRLTLDHLEVALSKSEKRAIKLYGENSDLRHDLRQIQRNPIDHVRIGREVYKIERLSLDHIELPEQYKQFVEPSEQIAAIRLAEGERLHATAQQLAQHIASRPGLLKHTVTEDPEYTRKHQYSLYVLTLQPAPR